MTGKRRAEPPPKQRRSARKPEKPSTGPVVSAIKTRRQLRQERRARRRRIGGTGIAVIVVVVAVIAAIAAYGVHKATNHPPASSDAKPQTTLLLQIAAPSGTSIGGILMAHDSKTDSGVELLVPSALYSSVCGIGEASFGSILAQPDGAHEAATTLSTLLGGVRIDGTWTLTTAQLASLVNAVGGISVNVDADVTQPGPHGTARVIVQRGPHVHLDGTQAAAYAGFHDGADEDVAAQLDRMQTVVQATIDALPTSASVVQQRIKALGSSAASTLGTSGLATLLAELAADDGRNGGVLPFVLPVNRLTVPGTASYGVNPGKTRQFVDESFADSLPAHATNPLTVELQNGLGTPGLVPAACRQLSAAGMTPSTGGNVTFSNARSQILIQERTVTDTEQGDRVAAVLHLPKSDVEVAPFGQRVANIVVILGKDYQP